MRGAARGKTQSEPEHPAAADCAAGRAAGARAIKIKLTRLFAVKINLF